MKKIIGLTTLCLMLFLCMPTMALATNGSGGSDTFIGIAGSIAIGLVVAFLVTSVFRGQLKSVRFQDSASFYVSENSLKVTKSRDLYLGSQVTRRHIPRPEKNK